MALETLHRSEGSEGSAWLGRDLRQMGTGARLDSNLPAMSRAGVRTNSFTVAARTQKEAMAEARTVAQRRTFPFVGDNDTRRSLQPCKTVWAEIARHGR